MLFEFKYLFAWNAPKIFVLLNINKISICYVLISSWLFSIDGATIAKLVNFAFAEEEDCSHSQVSDGIPEFSNEHLYGFQYN